MGARRLSQNIKSKRISQNREKEDLTKLLEPLFQTEASTLDDKKQHPSSRQNWKTVTRNKSKMPWTQEEIDAWKKRLVATESLKYQVADFTCTDQDQYNSPRRNTNGYGRNFNRNNSNPSTPSSATSTTKNWKSKSMKDSVNEPGIH